MSDVAFSAGCFALSSIKDNPIEKPLCVFYFGKSTIQESNSIFRLNGEIISCIIVKTKENLLIHDTKIYYEDTVVNIDKKNIKNVSPELWKIELNLNTYKHSSLISLPTDSIIYPMYISLSCDMRPILRYYCDMFYTLVYPIIKNPLFVSFCDVSYDENSYVSDIVFDDSVTEFYIADEYTKIFFFDKERIDIVKKVWNGCLHIGNCLYLDDFEFFVNGNSLEKNRKIYKSVLKLQKWIKNIKWYRLYKLSKTEKFCIWPENIGGKIAKRRLENFISKI